MLRKRDEVIRRRSSVFLLPGSPTPLHLDLRGSGIDLTEIVGSDRSARRGCEFCTHDAIAMALSPVLCDSRRFASIKKQATDSFAAAAASLSDHDNLAARRGDARESLNVRTVRHDKKDSAPGPFVDHRACA
jgi:hypothetical protein